MAVNRRRFLAVSALVPAVAVAASATPSVAAARERAARERSARPADAAVHTFGFAADGSAFLLDGKPFQIRAGEMHPARIPAEYWRHRIRMAKAMGLNTISIYVFWNYHEMTPGVFDFTTERRDIVRFAKLCQAENMWLLLRPGPYCCGEWDLGGIPPYLLSHPDIRLRVRTADDPHYMAAVRRYFAQLIPVVKPLMIDNGGPILMTQIENEYGSYGDDHTYLEELRQIWIDAGIDVPFYTEDGLGQLEDNHTNLSGAAIALSGGDAAAVEQCRAEYPDVPAFGGEVYPGWLTHWGDDTFAGRDYDISDTLREFMAKGDSFNLYMLHGGTSFGFWAGANADNLSGNYQPDITSYDYSAPITEQGRATAHYDTYRSIIADGLATSPPPVPAPLPTTTSRGTRTIEPLPYASVWDNLPEPVATTRNPRPMEMHGQDFGFILYRTTLSDYRRAMLDIRWVHDYATVFLDGSYQGGFSRPAVPDDVAVDRGITNGNAPLALGASSADPTLEILVEGMGRTNYGQALVDRKGILEAVFLRDAAANNGRVTDWRTYSLPMDDDTIDGLRPTISDPSRPGLFFRARFDLDTLGDTYVDVSQWAKGVVWVNGHNLGRFWEIGPQHRLFCPRSWLKRHGNELLIFDLHRTSSAPVTLEATLG